MTTMGECRRTSIYRDIGVCSKYDPYHHGARIIYNDRIRHCSCLHTCTAVDKFVFMAAALM